MKLPQKVAARYLVALSHIEAGHPHDYEGGSGDLYLKSKKSPKPTHPFIGPEGGKWQYKGYRYGLEKEAAKASKVALRYLSAGSDGNYMSAQNIKDIHSMSGDLMLHIHQGDELEDWVDDKISSARQEMSDVHRFYDSGQGDLKTLSSRLATRYLGPLSYEQGSSDKLTWHEQIFEDKEGSYKISDIDAYAKEYYPKIEKISIYPWGGSELKHNLESSEDEEGEDLPGHPDFIKRAETPDFNTSQSAPIHVIGVGE
jgi:hypothetical protein